MSRDQAILTWLRETFSASRTIDECLDKSVDREIIVCEKGGEGTPCAFHQVATDGFRIKNSLEKELYLLATDQCFFTAKDEKRCDCIVFDNHYCCFVELKLQVRKWSNFADNAKDARKQLGNTIRFFEESLIVNSQEFFGFKREAYLVMRDNVYPRNVATRNDVRVRFLQEYKVPLFEQNKKEF